MLLIQPLQNRASATSGEAGYFVGKSASSARASPAFFVSASVRAACSVADGASGCSGNADTISRKPATAASGRLSSRSLHERP